VIARAAALAVMLATSAGHAAPVTDEPVAPTPSQAAIEAGDANLEAPAGRSGIVSSVSFGGGLMVGFGIPDSVGRGGQASFRIGRVASPRTVIDLELDIVASLHRQATNSAAATNTDSNLLIGAQYYVNPSLWVRGAGGLGVYDARQVVLGNGTPGERTLVGPAVLGALGIELLRFKWAVLGVEVSASAMVSHDGVLIANGLDLGLAFD
jgi:hypothetical protein